LKSGSHDFFTDFRLPTIKPFDQPEDAALTIIWAHVEDDAVTLPAALAGFSAGYFCAMAYIGIVPRSAVNPARKCSASRTPRRLYGSMPLPLFKDNRVANITA